MILTNTQTGYAQKLDAGAVIDRLGTESKTFYLTGLIEGMAYARFLRDRPDSAGYDCVRNWLNRDAKSGLRKILATFERHRDKPPAVLLHALIKRDCGA